MCETCGCSDEASVRLIDVNTGKVILSQPKGGGVHSHVDENGNVITHSHDDDHAHTHENEHEHGDGVKHSHAHDHEHEHVHEDGTRHSHAHTHEDEHELGDGMKHSHVHGHEHEHVHEDGTRHSHEHTLDDEHTHGDGTKHTHVQGHEHEHVHEQGTRNPSKVISLEQDVLSKNNALAMKNRRWLQKRAVSTLNFVSAPGSGKTTLLEKTIKELISEFPISVLEGDQETLNDAMRIKSTGCQVYQINTGAGCHLEAEIVGLAMEKLNPAENSLLIIENVGNLVCPALFDLGEQHKVVVLSVTEGEDKPLKYPHMFRAADVLILNKIDLLPYLEYDLDACIKNALSVNSKLKIFQISATRGQGMEEWFSWLRNFVLNNQLVSSKGANSGNA